MRVEPGDGAASSYANEASADLDRMRLTQMGIEPRHGSTNTIPLVGGFGEVVTFVLVDNELGFDA